MKRSNPTRNEEASLPWFYIFLICCCILSMLLILFGFLPVKNISWEMSSLDSLPNIIDDTRIDPQEFYFPRIGRLVFVVIDALRWDFFNDPGRAGNLPFIRSLLDLNQACLFHAECSVPTVTMPRIKALMTGSVPNFIDVVMNFGSSKVKEDSLITQAVNLKRNIIFYGDDTWIKMFPTQFSRSEGTTSFFVSDYEEVDFNVSRHLSKELASSDWDIMVLHYLGLDHIGHLSGPFSPLIGPKLREMDQVVKMLINILNDTKKKGLPSLVVVAGDHGMRNSGGHGGSTRDEILTTLMFLQPGCNQSQRIKPNVRQIDVTPTLAVLLGLPIPYNSIGMLIQGTINSLPPLHRLYALHYNAINLKKHAELVQCHNAVSQGQLKEGEKNFARLLTWNDDDIFDEQLFELTLQLYGTVSLKMSECLAHSHDVFYTVQMISGCVILLMVVLTIMKNLLLGVQLTAPPKKKLLTAIMSFTFVAAVFDRTISAVFVLLIIAIFLTSLWTFPRISRITYITKIRHSSYSSIFLYLGCILQNVSLFSSSLVEEEHQTWYFLWATLCLSKALSIRVEGNCKHVKSGHWTTIEYHLLILLVFHRLLRALNQTGNKWADLPDVSDWLLQPQNWCIHLIFTLIGLLGVHASLVALHRINDMIYQTLSGLALVCVLLCRVANDSVMLPFPYPKSRGVAEANIYWILVATLFLWQFWSRKNLMATITSSFVLVFTFLLRPHNIIIIPFVTFGSSVLFSAFPSLWECSLVHTWMASTAFFYQGNSNSLTTVDVAAGYIGSAAHNMTRVSLMVFFHTFGTSILSFLLLLLGVRATTGRKSWYICLELTMLLRLLPLLMTSLTCILHLHHLFLWTVFAPKLLYEVAATVAILILITPGWIIMLLFPKTLRSDL